MRSGILWMQAMVNGKSICGILLAAFSIAQAGNRPSAATLEAFERYAQVTEAALKSDRGGETLVTGRERTDR